MRRRGTLWPRAAVYGGIVAALLGAACGSGREPNGEPVPTSAWTAVLRGDAAGYRFTVLRAVGSRNTECLAAEIVRSDNATFDVMSPHGQPGGTTQISGVQVPIGAPTYRGHGYACFTASTDESNPLYVPAIVEGGDAAAFGMSFVFGVAAGTPRDATVHLIDGTTVAAAHHSGVIAALLPKDARVGEIDITTAHYDAQCRQTEAASGTFSCTVQTGSHRNK